MRRLLFLACAMVLVDTVLYGTLTPLVPYFEQQLGLSKSLVGVMSGAYGAGVLVGSAPGGYLAARLGVKPAGIAGFVLIAGASLLFGLADEAWQLVALRFAAGFGSALNWVAAFAWVVARAPEERRGEMIGTLLSAAVVGALLGPALGGMAATMGVPLVFTLVSVLGLAVAVWAALTPAPGPSPAMPLREVFGISVRRPRLLVGLFFLGFSPLLFGTLSTLVPLQLATFGWGAAAIGTVFLVAALCEAVVHPVLGRWSDRVGYKPPVLAGILGSLAILLLLPFSPYAALVALLVVLAGIAFNAPLVPGTALFSRGAEKAGIGSAPAFGAANFAWAAGYALGASSGGFIADLAGDTTAYLALAVVCLLSLALLRQDL